MPTRLSRSPRGARGKPIVPRRAPARRTQEPAEAVSSSTPLVVGNWKMNFGDQRGVRLAREVRDGHRSISSGAPRLVLCPPFTALPVVAEALHGSAVQVGAQDVSWLTEGAHTGEVSAEMLSAVGCAWVIVGHSERRHTLGETDETVGRKLRRAVEAGLTPILCVGETWDEREEQRSEVVVMRQLESALAGVSLPAGRRLVVAYEPVWAIGSGHAVSPSEAGHMASLIRHLAVDGGHYGFTCPDPDSQVEVLYGGSVDARNVSSFCQLGVVEGVLVGGTSLSVRQFTELLRSIVRVGS